MCCLVVTRIWALVDNRGSVRQGMLIFTAFLLAPQRVVPAQYAFVIHTKNPSNNDEQEVFCEMVRGLGGWGSIQRGG